MELQFRSKFVQGQRQNLPRVMDASWTTHAAVVFATLGNRQPVRNTEWSRIPACLQANALLGGSKLTECVEPASIVSSKIPVLLVTKTT